MCQNTFERSIGVLFTPEALAANPFAPDIIKVAEGRKKEKQMREAEVRHLIELPLPVLEACLKRFTAEEELDVDRLKREYQEREALIENLLRVINSSSSSSSGSSSPHAMPQVDGQAGDLQRLRNMTRRRRSWPPPGDSAVVVRRESPLAVRRRGGRASGASGGPPRANHRQTVWIKPGDEKGARSAGNSPKLKSRSKRVVDLVTKEYRTSDNGWL
eukprot:gene1025-7730_t